jgi:hypothetical protein
MRNGSVRPRCVQRYKPACLRGSLHSWRTPNSASRHVPVPHTRGLLTYTNRIFHRAFAWIGVVPEVHLAMATQARALLGPSVSASDRC